MKSNRTIVGLLGILLLAMALPADAKGRRHNPSRGNYSHQYNSHYGRSQGRSHSGNSHGGRSRHRDFRNYTPAIGYYNGYYDDYPHYSPHYRGRSRYGHSGYGHSHHNRINLQLNIR